MHLSSLQALQFVVASAAPLWSWPVPRAAAAALTAAHQRKQMLQRSPAPGCAGKQQGLCVSHLSAAPRLLRQLQRPSCSLLPQRAGLQSSSGRVQAAHTLTQAQAAHPSFLGNLSAEQRDAVVAEEQHIRVIAGPGSGKTRVVAARVGWLLHQGASARSILAITFTRKAANELRTRLSADTGKVPYGLKACTFHSLCTDLLRTYAKEAGTEGWTVAAEDDCKGIIEDILQPRPQEEKEEQQQHAAGEGSDEEQPVQGSSSTRSSSSSSSRSSSSKSSKPKGPEKEMVRYFRSRISAMKNFVESTHSQGRLKSGLDIIAELKGAAAPDFAKMNEQSAARLASVFDRYQAQLRWQRLLDFDDLLHHCLALVHSNEQVRADIHRRWKHVHVDEGQDTNLCQFELVRQITGPDSTLFMVGDPDQAIYYFRGAQAIMLQERFLQLYAGSAATYNLRDNYRSHAPIITVADSIRKHLRPRTHMLVHGRSMRKAPDQHVLLVAAPSEAGEWEVIVNQLQEWNEEQGYAWDDMAVLARSKQQLKLAYLHAIRNGVPAHLQTGDFWEAPEVKAALALLRAVVHPVAASEGIKRRIIKSSSEVKVPLTSGFGAKPLEALDAIVLASNLARDRSNSSNSSSSGSATHAADAIPSSLSGCLLAGCGLGSLSQQEAAAVWQQWEDADAAGEDWMGALQSLAPQWQQPPGMKKLTKKQQAGLDRLRGLVQLATAAAVLGRPVQEIVQLLLVGSGMVQALQETASKAADKGDGDKLRRGGNRARNLRFLVQLAGQPDFALQAVPMLDSLEEDDESDEQGEDEFVWPESPFSVSSSADSTAGSSSSTSVAVQGLWTASSSGGSSSSSNSGGGGGDTSLKLQEFMDFCGLQGDDDGEQAGPRKPRVAFLTMHASKGKEFGCVVAMSFYEGGLPSAQALSAMEMEQERNLAYVAVTRAKDQLLITWPKEFLARTQTGFLRSMSTQESSFLKDALFAARQRKLPGVQYKEADV